jgi:hypothetical protein
MADPQEAAPGEPHADSADSTQANLPFVEAPKLDGAQLEAAPSAAAATEEAASASGGVAAPASMVRSLRFATLAGSVAGAILFGSLSAAAVAHFWTSAAAPAMADANVLQALKAQGAALAALKASVDGVTRSTGSQFAKIADRLDRVERAQVEPAAKIGHIADVVDRLDQRGAVLAETTGSVASNQPPIPGGAKPSDRVLQDWAVQSVHGGRALVGSRYGGLFEVARGSILPGLGRVEAIKRQEGQWIIVTAAGVITER